MKLYNNNIKSITDHDNKETKLLFIYAKYFIYGGHFYICTNLKNRMLRKK